MWWVWAGSAAIVVLSSERQEEAVVEAPVGGCGWLGEAARDMGRVVRRGGEARAHIRKTTIEKMTVTFCAPEGLFDGSSPMSYFMKKMRMSLCCPLI